MPKEFINLQKAAEKTGMAPGDLRAIALQGDIPCFQRAEGMLFLEDDLDLWISKNIVSGKDARKTRRQHASPGNAPKGLPLSELCPRQCITCSLPGSSRATIIRAITDLADKSGFLYDPEDLRREITRREEAGSTNIGNGIAIPHTMVREEGYFSETFICIAKLARPSYFNSAPDGSITELLILSCCQDSAEHLNILARLSDICRLTDFMEDVREAETDEGIYEALVKAEEQVARINRRGG